MTSKLNKIDYNSFSEKSQIPLGLTFDDVLLVPNHSPIKSRKEVDVSSLASKNIPIAIPIISSNMDTVTESTMAIEMARNGGLGIIHRFMSIDDQVHQIQKVKRSMSILIDKPYTLPITSKLKDAWQLSKEKSVTSLLIVENQKLKGILTARDIMFEDDPKIPVETLMTTDLIVGPPNISLDDAKEILKKNKIEKLPLVNKNGNLKGLITTKDLQESKKYKNATKDDKGRLRVGAAIGVKDDFIERTKLLLSADCDVIVVDVAHGHSDLVMNAIRKIRQTFGDEIELIAGNVATASGAEDLISQGVDAIKVGVGPGSICITRIVAGSGVPQLSAIMDTSSIANDLNIPVIADGGIKNSGDIAKAVAAGASSVMLGNLLAGTTESPGFPVFRNGRRVKIIRGMASLGASLGRNTRTKGSFDDDYAIDYVSEGVEAVVPFRGDVRDVLHQLVGGLRSGMSYVGATNIQNMWELAKFIRMTPSGKNESKSHDVDVV